MIGHSVEARHVAEQLAPLRKFIDRDGVLEVCVNKPGEVFVEDGNGFEQVSDPAITFERMNWLARAVATFSKQTLSDENPLLSAALPTGERVQFVLPPAIGAGLVSVTIRKPSNRTFSLGELESYGLFSDVRVGRGGFDDNELVGLRDDGRWVDFLRAVVVGRRNVLISGATGSGKTTLSKALVAEIPRSERIIVVEDTPELSVACLNAVFLRYSKDGQGLIKVGVQQLLEACLRMRPDRILLQELRDEAAFYYLRAVNAGHPGSVTTVHADNCALAIEQLTLLVKQSAAGAQLDRLDIRNLLAAAIDIVVQMKRVAGKFRVTEIKFGREAAGLQ